MDDCEDFLLFLSSDDFQFEHDAHQISISDCDLQPSLPEPPTTKRSRAFKPLQAKRSRRTEIRLLREEVAQLSSLHTSILSRCTGDNTVRDDLEFPPEVKTEDSDWKQRADQQFQLREAAMRENLQLRSQLTAIAELGDRLQRQLKHQETHLQAHDPHKTRHHYQLLAAPNSFLRVDQEPHASIDLLQRVQRLYGRTHVAVDERRIQLQDPLAACVRDVQCSARSDKLDIFDTRVVPFDLRATADAVWEWMLSGHGSFRCQSDEGISLDGTVQRSFSGEKCVDAMQLRCHGCFVFRRFEEQDRVVFVTTARVHLDEPLTVVYHSQWIVVARPLLATTTNALATCSEIVCRDLSELLDVPSEACELPRVVTVGVDENRERMNAFVDTKLLDAARQIADHEEYPFQ